MVGTATVMAKEPAMLVATATNLRYTCGSCGHSRLAHSCAYRDNCFHNQPSQECHAKDCNCERFT